MNFEDNLEVIREEQNSPQTSIDENKEEEKEEEEEGKENEPVPFIPTVKCICANEIVREKEEKDPKPDKIQQILHEKEMKLRQEYENKLEKETSYLKERFNFILQ